MSEQQLHQVSAAATRPAAPSVAVAAFQASYGF